MVWNLIINYESCLLFVRKAIQNNANKLLNKHHFWSYFNSNMNVGFNKYYIIIIVFKSKFPFQNKIKWFLIFFCIIIQFSYKLFLFFFQSASKQVTAFDLKFLGSFKLIHFKFLLRIRTRATNNNKK